MLASHRVPAHGDAPDRTKSHKRLFDRILAGVVVDAAHINPIFGELNN